MSTAKSSKKGARCARNKERALKMLEAMPSLEDWLALAPRTELDIAFFKATRGEWERMVAEDGHVARSLVARSNGPGEIRCRGCGADFWTEKLIADARRRSEMRQATD